MPELKINGVPIQDDYSETFAAQCCRVLITGVNRKWALEAALETKGIGRSATQPPCEATLEREVPPAETPDGRPGFLIQMMDRKLETLKQCLALRLRKGAVPVPTSGVFDGLPRELAADYVDLEGSVIQKFGDGFERESIVYGRNVYQVPRMDGWLNVERKFGVVKAVTGGMFLILATSNESALAAAERTLEQVSQVPMIVVKCAASGSKVGAKNYTDMVATTNDVYCPTLADRPETKLPKDVHCVYEIIISGPREADVRRGMRVGIEAATSKPGVVAIHTANYGGKLGSGKIHLHELFAAPT
jgi:formylmethanofuran--tetrahydromethanopterin N-formyltransferase